MSMATARAADDVIRRVRRKIEELVNKEQQVLSIDDVSIVLALEDDRIEELVLVALKEARRPLSWRELKQIFAGIVGEDRLRRVLSHLKVNNVIAELTHTRYSLPEYVDKKEIDKVKNPEILRKIVRYSESN